MTHTPHELAAEFPAAAERIHLLKLSDPRFARLADRYHFVNRAIHRAETRVAPVDEMHEKAMRRERMQLKDALSRMIH